MNWKVVENMKCDKKNMCLYAVTDRAWIGAQSLYEQVEAALVGGITCLQLREKELDPDAFLKEALLLKEICKEYKVPLIINDNVEIALQSGADGVHVGQSDLQAGKVREIVGADMILGVSVQTVEQALLAQENGADYLGVGAVFSTSTKKDASAVTKETLAQICQATEIPVVAIGGISEQNMPELAGSGIDGVALVSAIFGSQDITAACQNLNRLVMYMLEKKV